MHDAMNNRPCKDSYPSESHLFHGGYDSCLEAAEDFHFICILNENDEAIEYL